MSFELFCRQWNPQQAEEGNCLRPTGMQILDQLEAEVDDADSPRLPHRPIRRVFTSWPRPTSWTLCNSAIPALGRTHHLEGISPLWPPMSGKTIKLSLSQFSSVQSLSRVRLFATPWIAAHQAPLSITNSQSSPKLTSIKSLMPSSHLILCRPLLLLPSIPPSIRVISNESTLCIRWPKYWSFSFSIIPSKEHPELISFRMNWLDLLAVQGTLKSLLQHHSSKASILRHSAFFIVQLSYPYLTTGKTIALTKRTFVGKVMSLVFNTLSRLVMTFFPRGKCLLISWLQSPSAVILLLPTP